MSTPARNTSPHPGVVVIRPTQRRPYYALRYVDPVTQTQRQARADDVESDDAARAAAVQLAQTLRALRGPSTPPAQSAPAPATRVQLGSPTRGVVIIKPTPRRPYYQLRYTDPATGKTCQSKLQSVTTREAAEEAAQKKSTSLAKLRDDIELAGGVEAIGVANTIAAERALYMQAVALKERESDGKRTSPITLARYEAALKEFDSWCAGRGVEHIAQLSKATLSDWRRSRQTKPTRGGLRKTSTVNQEVKPIRQMLIAAACEGRMAHMSSDAVRTALARLPQAKPKPRCYNVVEIRDTLRAALDYDVSETRPRGAPIAPVVAVALLTGMRRGELAKLQCRDVHTHAPSGYDPRKTTGVGLIHLPAHKVKTGVKRDIHYAPYSTMLGELMAALKGRRPGQEYVFRVGYIELGDVAKRLRDYGAPAGFAWKDLRSTCATYQSPLPGNFKAKADRQGHTLDVAEKHYLSLPTDTPTTAPDLETIMQCAAELREVIDRLLKP